jgi:hypothetical protein
MMVAPRSPAMPSRSPAARALRTSVPQVFSTGFGWPVEPEVNRMIVFCAAGMEGNAGAVASSAGAVTVSSSTNTPG